ncbi:transcriptional regulator, TetR family [Chloroherpeton thalassium ATCC 35110]|uniref:Transcriptional regulator, TetR family n=1 Tax=Chloroherpeton thalassium (strain ATCC 35110 / GB-78) TaxID=517418 RepID=B3QT40_CHLT3|nr:TetR/AcrR family transcriptional regulator [Chloroherpeton thalassium]ACF14139.1 transcriptional regulator, TetR family [Chloroherpeton thalassium ATCC 35110]
MGYIERKKRERERVRQSILDAALNIAIAEGWNSVTIRKISDAIEYTPPVIYEHFKNKDALLNEMVLVGFRMLHESFNTTRKNESDPRKILMTHSLNHWDFAVQHKELYQLMFSHERKRPSEELAEMVRELQDFFQELSTDGTKADELMFNWMCLQQGYIFFHILQMEPPSELSSIPPKKLFENAIVRFLKGI